tara:strand:+ start:598 stop:894 length:297 start_codon:yes stop_codon:yes gene_type:complete
MRNLKIEWAEVNLIKIFEVAVIDTRSQEEEYIIFDISIQDNKFIAQHEALNLDQAQSDKIAFVSVDLDPVFSLDENLQDLFAECLNAVIESSYFNLKE